MSNECKRKKISHARQRVITAVASGFTTTTAISKHLNMKWENVRTLVRSACKCGDIVLVDEVAEGRGSPTKHYGLPGSTPVVQQAKGDAFAALKNFINPFTL